MMVYHYMTSEAFAKSVSEGGIWIKASHPSEFNDPFECTGGVWGVPSDDFAREFYESRPDLKACGMFYNNPQEYVRDWFWHAFADRNFLGQGYRISCFVNAGAMMKYPGQDMRMWAHYAEYGKGVRLTFDSDFSPFNYEKVEYDLSAPILDLSLVENIDGLSDFIEKCIHTKQKSWEPEQELRVIFRGPSEKVVFCDECKIYRWLMPINALREVAVGENSIRQECPTKNCAFEAVRCANAIGQQARTCVAVRDFNHYNFSYQSIS